MGLGGVIVHGLFTYSSTCHEVLRAFCGSDATRLKEYQARFASPVRPGDTLVTEMWNIGGVFNGLQEIRFITKNGDGRVVLSNGRALITSRRIRDKL